MQTVANLWAQISKNRKSENLADPKMSAVLQLVVVPDEMFGRIFLVIGERIPGKEKQSDGVENHANSKCEQGPSEPEFLRHAEQSQQRQDQQWQPD